VLFLATTSFASGSTVRVDGGGFRTVSHALDALVKSRLQVAWRLARFRQFHLVGEALELVRIGPLGKGLRHVERPEMKGRPVRTPGTRDRKWREKRSQIQPQPSPTGRRGDSSINGEYLFHDRDKNSARDASDLTSITSYWGSFYRDGCDGTGGKIAMRSPRTEPSQSSLAT
jgi:hypothetical protein